MSVSVPIAFSHAGRIARSAPASGFALTVKIWRATSHISFTTEISSNEEVWPFLRKGRFEIAHIPLHELNFQRFSD